jgi:hypothetical protein
MNTQSFQHIRGLCFGMLLVAYAPNGLASAGAAVTRTCDGLFSPSTVSVDPHAVAKIVAGLEKSGVADVLNPKDCAAFVGACALASITVGVEATEQLHGAAPSPSTVLRSEAQQMLELVSSITKRDASGMSIGETIGVLRFNLARRGQASRTTLRFETLDEPSDLALAPNEMMILAADAGLANHMVLMFEQKGDLSRVVDPQTGKIEEYRAVQTPSGKLRLVSLTNPVGWTSVLELVGAIRISPEARGPRVPGPNIEARQQTEITLRKLKVLRSIVEDFYSLLPTAKNSPFKTMEEARRFVKARLDEFNFGKNVLKTDVGNISNVEDAGLIFDLQLTVADIQRRADEVGFFGWLEHNGLTAPTAKPVVLPKWDIRMLEARASTKLKEDRARAMLTLDALLHKKTLSQNDVELGIGRAAGAYVDLIMAAVSEVQPADAHRLMTPYLEKLEALMKSPQIESQRQNQRSSRYVEIVDSKLRQYRAGRAQLGLDSN